MARFGHLAKGAIMALSWPGINCQHATKTS